MNKKKLFALCFVITSLNTFMIHSCWDCLCCCFTTKEEKQNSPKKDLTMSVIAATLTTNENRNQPSNNSSNKNDPRNTPSPFSPSSAKDDKGLHQGPNYGSFEDDGFKKEQSQNILIAQANE
jgi:hypothetical protein